jgi:hypothetical protein
MITNNDADPCLGHILFLELKLWKVLSWDDLGQQGRSGPSQPFLWPRPHWWPPAPVKNSSENVFEEEEEE